MKENIEIIGEYENAKHNKKLLSGTEELSHILDVATYKYEEAEKLYKAFEKKYSEEEIEVICEKLNVEIDGVFSEDLYG